MRCVTCYSHREVERAGVVVGDNGTDALFPVGCDVTNRGPLYVWAMHYPMNLASTRLKSGVDYRENERRRQSAQKHAGNSLDTA